MNPQDALAGAAEIIHVLRKKLEPRRTLLSLWAVSKILPML